MPSVARGRISQRSSLHGSHASVVEVGFQLGRTGLRIGKPDVAVRAYQIQRRPASGQTGALPAATGRRAGAALGSGKRRASSEQARRRRAPANRAQASGAKLSSPSFDEPLAAIHGRRSPPRRAPARPSFKRLAR